MLPQERHQLLGKIVDAMIYSDDACVIMRAMVKTFEDMGMIRSVILPQNDSPTHVAINSNSYE